MSEHAYKIDQTQSAIGQLRAIAAQARLTKKSRALGSLLRRAMYLLETDPHGWGDPAYRAKTVDAIACRGILRPLAFEYVIYEPVHIVVLQSITQFADFS